MENIFTKEAMELAVENLLMKNDSCGVDGICISAYREYYDLNGEEIRQRVFVGLRIILIFTVILWSKLRRYWMKCSSI